MSNKNAHDGLINFAFVLKTSYQSDFLTRFLYAHMLIKIERNVRLRNVGVELNGISNFQSLYTFCEIFVVIFSIAIFFYCVGLFSSRANTL